MVGGPSDSSFFCPIAETATEDIRLADADACMTCSAMCIQFWAEAAPLFRCCLCMDFMNALASSFFSLPVGQTKLQTDDCFVRNCYLNVRCQCHEQHTHYCLCSGLVVLYPYTVAFGWLSRVDM